MESIEYRSIHSPLYTSTVGGVGEGTLESSHPQGNPRNGLVVPSAREFMHIPIVLAMLIMLASVTSLRKLSCPRIPVILILKTVRVICVHCHSVLACTCTRRWTRSFGASLAGVVRSLTNVDVDATVTTDSLLMFYFLGINFPMK